MSSVTLVVLTDCTKRMQSSPELLVDSPIGYPRVEDTLPTTASCPQLITPAAIINPH